MTKNGYSRCTVGFFWVGWLLPIFWSIVVFGGSMGAVSGLLMDGSIESIDMGLFIPFVLTGLPGLCLIISARYVRIITHQTASE